MSGVIKYSAGLAIAASFMGLAGCAGDNAVGGAALAASMMGADVGMLAPVAEMAAGAYVASAVMGPDGETIAPASAAASSPAPTVASSSPSALAMTGTKTLPLETPERYRHKSCEYIEVSLTDAHAYETSGDPVWKQVGTTRKALANQAWFDKGCQRANLPWGKIGLSIHTVDPQLAQLRSYPTSGVVVVSALPGSPAQQAGMLPWDIVIAVGDQPVADSEDFRIQVGKVAIGSSITLKTWRAGTYSNIPVVVTAGDTQKATK
ncbi:hypothetical protein DBR00_20325 [Pseudomonas sp. HMWF032]|uniref:PDZ domain-containing protein n=1 Tax=Pseudomonas sp. HMWF032 TaxID=2056866 RepID=UPI000D3878DC|nr:PDZ domain-containing protein [Pseudomonas sp. HMWF032]PTS82441.1 hypothetical protein DBR00_20325 [Pseudomonas sp. HMWF032]PTT80755.1 hypothetical protein DBR41_18865 [Pseudomonas sp. HMWF010]